MDLTHDDSSQWEQSKENIQPLKQGRKATVLSVVLDDNAAQKLNIMRHEFEEELRTYTGDDPLDVWYRYILWVEQNYPKGGKEGKLTELIEKCLMTMYGNSDVREKYVSDERFLDIWIRYANLSPNPLEIYQTLEAKALCLYLADFYINWAWEMEKTGNYKRADAIYEKGLQAGAKPLGNLHESHKKFQIRVARSTIEDRAREQESNTVEQGRVALSSLKSQGRRIGTNRSGPTLIGPAGRCPQDSLTKRDAVSSFSIFKDTSTKENPTSTRGDDQGALGLGASTNRENIRNPGQWKKAKVKQKAAEVVPVEDVDKYHRHDFSVHEDENTSQQMRSQTRFSTASHVLSQHKEEYDRWNVQLFVPEPFNPNVQPQYCKHKVYCGTEEFSFEELRAAQHTKKEREKEKENELQRMRDELKKKEELIQKLLKQNEVKQDKPSKSGHVLYQDSWLSVNKSVNASVNASNFHDESANPFFQKEPPVIIGFGKKTVCNDPALAMNPCSQEQGNLSTSGNYQGLSFSDPTGDAANIIDSLWSTSLSQSVSQQPSDIGVGLTEPTTKDKLPLIYEDGCSKSEEVHGRKPASSFVIFSDPVSENPKPEAIGMPLSSQVLKEKSTLLTTSTATKTVDVAPEEMIVNSTENYPEIQDENRPPPGMVLQQHEARQISGILQPAKDIPNLEDQERETKSAKIEERNLEYKQANDIESLYSSIMKNENLDDIVPLDGRQLEDFTIKLPNNEAIFSHMAKVASTPNPWALGCEPQSSSTKNDFTLTIDTENPSLPTQEEKNNYSLLKNVSEIEAMPPPSSTKTPGVAAATAAAATSMQYVEPEAGLSVIMEASREYRSSSSSSGCGTTPNTLQGHSEHGLSQPGNFSLSAVHMPRIHLHSLAVEELVSESAPPVQGGDFTKSGYLADKSRGESLAESLPYAARTAQPKSEDVSMSFCSGSAAAKMVMDFNELILSPCTDNKEEKCLDSKNINPFDEEVIDNILSNLAVPVEKRGGYVPLRQNMPCLRAGVDASLGKEFFHVCKMCGEGAYAKVYWAITMDALNVTLMPCDSEDDDEQQVILKLQKPACPWEFYICHELRQRLKASSYPQSFLDSVMKVDRGYFFINGSVLVSQYHKFGTLLDVINRYGAERQTVPEEVAMFFMIEILSILEAVHSCNIIHADIKPDNFVIQTIPECKTTSDLFENGPVCLKLIDFGRSIDMKAFPQGTSFTEVVTTEKFTCCEMRDGRRWTYQTDYFGAAAIAHLFLFGTYMDLKKTDTGKWNITGACKRYWKKDLWENVFSTLLNVPSCLALPKLGDIKRQIITTFYQARMDKDISFKLYTLQHMKLVQK